VTIAIGNASRTILQATVDDDEPVLEKGQRYLVECI